MSSLSPRDTLTCPTPNEAWSIQSWLPMPDGNWLLGLCLSCFHKCDSSEGTETVFPTETVRQAQGPTRQTITSLLSLPPNLEWRCSQLHIPERKHRSRMRDKVRFMSGSSRRKHIHHWNKSLAGGFRCACEAWRCEFAEGIQQCEIASVQGRKYCLTHLASRPTSLSPIRTSRTSGTLAKS